jgi:hypothetical protein
VDNIEISKERKPLRLIQFQEHTQRERDGFNGSILIVVVSLLND